MQFDAHQGGTADDPAGFALAQVILSILPGFLLNLALDQRGVAGFPDAVRTLWPG